MRRRGVHGIIGPRWLVAAGADGEPRLAKSDDYVRAELTAALAHAKQVIPVLVGGSTMPSAAELPGGLEELGLRQAVVLHDASWHQDVDGLIRSLRGEPTNVQRRRWLIGLGTSVALLAVSGAAWLMLDNSGSKGSSSTEPASSTTTAPMPCSTPRSPEWKNLAVTGSTDVGDQFHYPRFYTLSLDGTTFEHDCFDVVAGQNPISPGGSSEALVGFELTVDPARDFALDLDTIGEFGRIDLTPAAGG